MRYSNRVSTSKIYQREGKIVRLELWKFYPKRALSVITIRCRYRRATPNREPCRCRNLAGWCRSQARCVYSGTPVIDAVVRVSANSASSSSRSRRKDASDCAGLSGLDHQRLLAMRSVQCGHHFVSRYPEERSEPGGLGGANRVTMTELCDGVSRPLASRPQPLFRWLFP